MEMSHGILEEVPIPENTTQEELASQLCKKLGDKKLSSEHSSWLEQLYWRHSEQYLVYKTKIYSYINKTSGNPYSRVIKHENGELEYFAYFHDGSMCLEDVLIAELDNTEM